MQKQFSKNILFLLLINFLVKPFYVLFIDAEVQNRVGPQEYGIYFALFNFCFLFQIVLDMGIQNYNSKTISQNRAEVAGHFATVLGAKLILVVGFVLAVFIFGMLVGYPRQYFPILMGVGVIMILQSLYVYLRSHFSAIGQFRTETWLSALDKVLMLVVLAYFIYVQNDISIPRFIVGQALALGLAIVIALVLLRSQFRLRVELSLFKTRKILKQSFPYAVVFILMTLYTRMDSVMLERLLDDKGLSAGIYANGYRLLDAVNILGYLFAVLLLPMFAKLVGDKADVTQLTKTATGILLTLATIVSALCWTYAVDIMDFVYDQVSLDSIQVFRWLMLSFWFMSISYIYGSLITASGNLRTFNLIFLIGIMINWILNLWLIPSQGAVGAALTTLITQAFVFCGQLFLAIQRFNLRFGTTYILKSLLFMVLSTVIVYLISNNVALLWIFEAFISGICILLISFLLGFIRLSLVKGLD